MKTIELKQLSVENYKKFESATYQFVPRTMISGKNGKGKSTLMDAYFDTLTGKLADGGMVSGVRRKVDGEETDGNVIRELVLLVDGMETVIRKKTTKSVTSYEVDGIKYSKTKLDEYLRKIAGPDVILMCSNARVFLNEIRKSTVGAREQFEKMAGFDLQGFMREYPKVMEITKGHSAEEVARKLNREKVNLKKEADDLEKEIVRVKTTDVAKSDTDLIELRNKLLDKMNELKQEERRLNDSSKAYDELSYEITGLKKSRDAISSKATEEVQEERRKIVSLLNEKQVEKTTEENHLRDLENKLARTDKPERLEQVISELQDKYKTQYAAKYDNSSKLEAIQNEEFDPTVAICPTCGQVLPSDQMEHLKVEFEQQKQERIQTELDKKAVFEKAKQQNLREISKAGSAAVAVKKEAEAKRKELEENIETSKKNIASLAVEISKLNKQLEIIPEPDLSDNEEYQRLVAEIQKKQEQLDGLTNNSDERERIHKEKLDITCKLAENTVLMEAQEKAEKEKIEKIDSLKAEKIQKGQEKSDIQEKLDLLKKFSIAKNQKLADMINPHFKHFQFQFLDYTQDGEPVEVCKMVVDGIDYFSGLNHSDQILCNIDLVAGLQELNGIRLPIWVDDAESVNTERFPKLEQQMIFLKVSDDELKVEEI